MSTSHPWWLIPDQQRAAYAASKGGVKQLTETLAAEWGRYKINVNNISPGYIITEMVQKLIEKASTNRTRWPGALLLGEWENRKIWSAAIFLCSPILILSPGTLWW